MNTTQNLLILGASTRAAAFSALRAGLAPRCADFFADRDLAAICPVERVDSQEGAEGLERAAMQLSGDAWIFTGPLENHPDLVERLSRTIPLLGTGPAELRAVRDPLRVAEALRANGLDAPEVRLSPEGLPRDGSWMVKPLASGGGRLVQILDENWRTCAEPCYFQQQLEGPSYSALFIADRGAADLIGVTKQLVGSPGSPFGYRGSVGPWQPSDALTRRLRAIGQTLSSSFALAGWFGVDFILHDGRPWPVEVNPRYVASIEVLELAMGRSLMAEHLRACGASGDRTPLFKAIGRRRLSCCRQGHPLRPPQSRRCRRTHARPCDVRPLRDPRNRRRPVAGNPDRIRAARVDRARLGPGHRDLRGQAPIARRALAAEVGMLILHKPEAQAKESLFNNIKSLPVNSCAASA